MVAEDFLRGPAVARWRRADLDAAHLPRFAGRTVAMKRSAASRANSSTATRTADRLMTLIWSSALSLVLEGFAAYPVGAYPTAELWLRVLTSGSAGSALQPQSRPDLRSTPVRAVLAAVHARSRAPAVSDVFRTQVSADRHRNDIDRADRGAAEAAAVDGKRQKLFNDARGRFSDVPGQRPVLWRSYKRSSRAAAPQIIRPSP